MSSIKIDDVIMSSAFPGFGYTGIISDSMMISGTVPAGGRTYTHDITVPAGRFIDAYYLVVGTNNLNPLGTPGGTSITGVGYNTTTKGLQTGDTYTVSILIDNPDSVSHTVPTQTINLTVYTFRSPFG